MLLIFLLSSKTQDEVNKVFSYLKEVLGISLYRKIFQIILTDNGSEFLNPIIFEIDLLTGKKISRIYYCDPYSSWQKGLIENSHKRIRIVLPKGTTFDNLTQNQVNILRDNIVNLYKDKIKKTPNSKSKILLTPLLFKLNYISLSINNTN